MIDYKEIEKYILLINRFLNKEISADEFQTLYFDVYLNDKTVKGDLYEILETFFSRVECYTDFPLGKRQDPDLHVTEAQLEKSAKETLEKLKNLK